MKQHDAVAVILRRIAMTAVILVILAVSGNAQYTPGSWPASFLDYTDSTGSYIQDISDQSPPETDVIYSTSTPSSVLVSADGTHAFFRMQLKADPYDKQWASFGWVVEIGDSTGQGAPIGGVAVIGSGSSLDVLIRDGTTEHVIYTYGKKLANPAAVRSSAAGSSGFFYLDFQVPMAALTNYLGVDGNSKLRFFYGSSASGSTVNKDYMTGSVVSFLGLTTTTFTSIENGTLVPLPVELTSFTALMKGTDVQLSWKTATETNNVGFDILRSVNGAGWTKQGFIAGAGNAYAPRNYTWSENLAGVSGAVRYRLRQIDRDGTVEHLPIVEVADQRPLDFGITHLYPQPARDQVTVQYTSAEESAVSMTLHDLAGRVLHRTQAVSGGAFSSTAQTLQLGDLPTGMYMLRLSNGGRISYKHLVISR